MTCKTFNDAYKTLQNIYITLAYSESSNSQVGGGGLPITPSPQNDLQNISWRLQNDTKHLQNFGIFGNKPLSSGGADPKIWGCRKPPPPTKMTYQTFDCTYKTLTCESSKRGVGKWTCLGARIQDH